MRLYSIAIAPILLASAGAAHADCPGEFAASNTWKAEAGPYRQIMHEQVTNELDGKQYTKRLPPQTYEFSPPEAVHISDKSPLGDTEAVYIGKEGWSKEGDSWKPVAAAEMAELIDGGLYGNYFNVSKLKELVCHGESVNSGVKVRSYSYVIPIEDIVPRELAVTAYFSAENGLPLAAVSETMVVKTFHRTEMAVEFDRSIKIERPR